MARTSDRLGFETVRPKTAGEPKSHSQDAEAEAKYHAKLEIPLKMEYLIE